MSADLQQIADHLNRTGLFAAPVTVEFPGCVAIWAEDLTYPDRAWWFGTANETWMASLIDGTGDYQDETLDTGVLSTEPDALTVAQAIVRVLQGGGL